MDGSFNKSIEIKHAFDLATDGLLRPSEIKIESGALLFRYPQKVGSDIQSFFEEMVEKFKSKYVDLSRYFTKTHRAVSETLETIKRLLDRETSLKVEPYFYVETTPISSYKLLEGVVQMSLGNVLLSRNDFYRANEMFREALSIFPEDQKLKSNLAEAKRQAQLEAEKRMAKKRRPPNPPNEEVKENNNNHVVPNPNPKFHRLEHGYGDEYYNAFLTQQQLLKPDQSMIKLNPPNTDEIYLQGERTVPGQLVEPLSIQQPFGVVPQGYPWGMGGSRKKTSKKAKKNKNKKSKKLNKRKN